MDVFAVHGLYPIRAKTVARRSIRIKPQRQFRRNHHRETSMNPMTQPPLKQPPPARIGWSYDNYFLEQLAKIKQTSNNKPVNLG
jgi:hypothetical protein